MADVLVVKSRIATRLAPPGHACMSEPIRRPGWCKEVGATDRTHGADGSDLLNSDRIMRAKSFHNFIQDLGLLISWLRFAKMPRWDFWQPSIVDATACCRLGEETFGGFVRDFRRGNLYAFEIVGGFVRAFLALTSNGTSPK